MKFQIFIPDEPIRDQRVPPYPVLYFLAGITSTYDNAPQKSNFGYWASKYKLAMVFPDTSPRNTGIEGIDKDWQFGDSAGFYVDATTEKYKKHFNMHTYVTKELPALVSKYFHIDSERQSIAGHSMGGLGTLLAFFKNPD